MERERESVCMCERVREIDRERERECLCVRVTER